MKNEDHKSEITFLESIVLLGLNDKGWFGNSESRIRFGLAGALLFELALRGEIEISGEQVVLIGENETGVIAYDDALKVLMKSGKKKNLNTTKAIQRIVYRSGLKWKNLLKELIRKKIIRKEEYRLFWVFYQEKYPVVKTDIKKQLLSELYPKIMGEHDLTPHDIMLLAVMRSCKMIDKNFPAFDHFMKVRTKIREITEFKEPLPDSTRMIRDIQSGINKAIRISNVSLHI